MNDPFTLTNLTASIWIFYTVVSNIIIATFLCSYKSEINDLKMKLLEHTYILRRLTKDMKLEPGEFIFVNDEDILLYSRPDSELPDFMKEDSLPEHT